MVVFGCGWVVVSVVGGGFLSGLRGDCNVCVIWLVWVGVCYSRAFYVFML